STLLPLAALAAGVAAGKNDGVETPPDGGPRMSSSSVSGADSDAAADTGAIGAIGVLLIGGGVPGRDAGIGGRDCAAGIDPESPNLNSDGGGGTAGAGPPGRT